MFVPTYSIEIKRSAKKEIAGLSKEDRLRVVAAIDGLATNPHQGSVLKGKLRGLRRLRVGSFRVIFEVMDDRVCVLVLRVGNQRDVYR